MAVLVPGSEQIVARMEGRKDSAMINPWWIYAMGVATGIAVTCIAFGLLLYGHERHVGWRDGK
jgi:hypothetical protein